MFTNEELLRYSRQTVLQQVGLEGQSILKKCRILCVGAGGLGSPVAQYLAAAGIGRIGIIDHDRVEGSNLHRQILFGSSNLGQLKAEAAKMRLEDLNPNVSIVALPFRFEAACALDVLKDFDIVVDGTDNFSTKFLINDAAVKLGIPVVYGAISGLEAQVAVFWAKRGPCYRCLYPARPTSHVQNCAEAGIIGSVAGIAGTLQATEAIKLALRDHPAASDLRPLVGRLLVIDTARMSFSTYAVSKRSDCRICGIHPDNIRLEDGEENCSLNPPQLDQEISPEELLDTFSNPSTILIDVRSPEEWISGHIPGALNWPLPRIESNDVPEISRTSHVIVYCKSGRRSQKAAQIFQRLGFSRIRNLKHGLLTWTGPLKTN